MLNERQLIMTVQDFIDITKSLNKNKPVYALVDYLYEDGE